MGLQRLPLFLLFGAAARLRPAALALHVDVTPVHRLDAPAAPHEALQQRWEITKSAPNDDAVRALVLDALCQVEVSFQPSDTPDARATVLVSGSDFKLITAADVVASAPTTLEIHHRDGPLLQSVDGFVGIQVLLHQQNTLQRLNVTGSGDVIVRDRVLVENAPDADVSVDARGAGAVFLPPQVAIAAKTITLAAAGIARLFVPAAATLNASVVSFQQSGSGAIAATSAEIRAARTVSVATSGAGEVCVDATFVETNAVQVHATGAGGVYVGGHDGSWDATHRYFCDVAQVYQSGSGSVDLGTIVCIDTDVELYGSGNVTVASARSLGGHAFGSGKILFAGDSPVDVLDEDPWAYMKQPVAHPADAYQRRTCAVPAAPPRALSRIGDQENRGVSLLHHVLTPARIGVIALLALCIGAAYLAETRRQRSVRSHARRGERTPLLGERDGGAAPSSL